MRVSTQVTHLTNAPQIQIAGLLEVADMLLAYRQEIARANVPQIQIKVPPFRKDITVASETDNRIAIVAKHHSRGTKTIQPTTRRSLTLITGTWLVLPQGIRHLFVPRTQTGARPTDQVATLDVL